MKIGARYTRLGAIVIAMASVVGGVVACGGDDDNDVDRGGKDGGGDTGTARDAGPGGSNDGGSNGDGGSNDSGGGWNDGGSNDGGGGSNDGGVGVKDGGPTDGGSANDGGGGEPSNGKTGYVSVTSGRFSGLQFHGASASFIDASGNPSGGSTCQTSNEGACTISTCPKATSSDAGTPKYVSAGTIEIRGPAILSPPIKLEPRSDNSYPTATDQTSLWEGGESISIKAAGSTNGVASFATTLKAPAKVTVAPFGQSIDRSKPLEVEWAFIGAAAGKVLTNLYASTPDGGAVYVSCEGSVADTKLTIPASALGKLPAGAGAFYVYVWSNGTLKVSDYSVNVMASTPGIYPDDSPAQGQITYR